MMKIYFLTTSFFVIVIQTTAQSCSAGWTEAENSCFKNEKCISISSNPNSPGLWNNIDCNLRSSFFCSKNSYGVKYAAECEDWPSNAKPVQLRCEMGTKIVIIKADFGRDKYSSACGDYFYDGNCTSVVNTTELVKDLCGNKQNCDVTPTIQIFPDPCYGQQKLLRVWYQCVGDVITTGGNANGKSCRFPFKYNNVLHYQCTYEDAQNFNNKKWCRTNDDSASTLEWGNCPSSPQENNGCNKEGYQSIDGGQNCYRLVSKQPKSWDNAQEFCKSEGGNLVSIRDGFEAAYVSLIKTGSVNLEWIGLRNNDTRNFFWSDNWQLSYSNWPSYLNSSIQPQNTCVLLNNSFWGVSSCNGQHDFICKISKEPLPTFTTPSVGTCPGPEWLTYGSYCYRIERIPRSYPEAKFDCSSKGGYVVSLASKAEMEFVKNNVDSRPVIFEIWIGLERDSSSGFYFWDDGSTFTFNSFAHNNHTQKCVYMFNNIWYDSDCFVNKRVYVCKRLKIGAILPTTRPVFNLTTISFTTHHYNDTTHNTIVTIPAVSEITSSKPTELFTNPEKISKSATTVGIIIGLVLAVIVVTTITLFILKTRGKINSFVPSFLRRTDTNSNFSYTKQQDSESVTIVNKNYKGDQN